MTENTMSGIYRTLGQRLDRFFHWWKKGLGACLPSWLRTQLLPEPEKWVLTLLDSGAEAFRLSADGEVSADSLHTFSGPNEIIRLVELLDPKSSCIELRVPSEWVFHKTVTLPVAAVRNIQQVLVYELNRLTPFSIDHVYLDHVVPPASGAQQDQVQVRLAVLQRRDVDRWIDGLLAARIPLISITANDVWEGLNFARSITRISDAQKKGRNYLRMALVGISAALFIAVIVTPLWQKRSTAMALENQVKLVKRKSEVVFNLKSKIEDTELSINHVIEQRNKKVPVIQVLDAVTRLLPDDTWVQQLEMKRDGIELRGESRQATRLIKLFEDSPSFADASFRSPVVQARDNERYHVAAKLMVSGVE